MCQEFFGDLRFIDLPTLLCRLLVRPYSLRRRRYLQRFRETCHASFSMSIADKAAEGAAVADVTIRPRLRVTSWRAFSEAPEH